MVLVQLGFMDCSGLEDAFFDAIFELNKRHQMTKIRVPEFQSTFELKAFSYHFS
jgi:hypothetical protein